MRLLGCHINNFGTFHDHELTFNDGLNVIMQANGWGKSTLAAFVKAMLYGFDGRRVRNVSQNERLRYTPWQGGAYGGSLDFEADGREYRVVRTFGRVASRDTLKVIDMKTGRSALGETGGNVGEWLFGLDANAFQKSVFVVQNGLGTDVSTAGLRNRLNALVNEADDVAGFDKAQFRLEARRKFYKRTGNRGAIADVSREVSKLVERSGRDDEKVASLRTIQADMVHLDETASQLDALISDAQAVVEREQAGEQERKALHKVGEQLRQRQHESRQAYDAAAKAFGGRVPSAKDLEQMRMLLADTDRYEGEAERCAEMVGALEEERSKISGKYASRVPSKRELQEKRNQVASLATREEAIAKEASAAERGMGTALGIADIAPETLARADELVAQYGEVSRVVAEGDSARARLEYERASWHERKGRIHALKEEAYEACEDMPENAMERAESLRGDARTLRAYSTECSRLEARRDEAAAKAEKAQSALAEMPERVSDEDIEELERLAAASKDAGERARDAREARDSAEAALPALRAERDEAQRRLDENREALSQTKPKAPTPSIACLALACLALVAGVVTGPVTTPSIALYAIGAVLLVVGVVLFTRRAPSTPSQPDETLVAGAERANAAYEEALRKAQDAARGSDGAIDGEREAAEDLLTAMSRLLPDAAVDVRAASAQAPLLRQANEARAEQEKRVADAERGLGIASNELTEVQETLLAILSRNGMDEGDPLRAAELLDDEAAELVARAKASNDAREALRKAVSAETGGDEEVDDAELAAFLDGLESWEPERIASLEEDVRSADHVADEYMDSLNDALCAMGLETVGIGNMAVGVERLTKAVADYREEESRAAKRKAELSVKANAIRDARSDLEAWAKDLGIAGAGELTSERLQEIDADIASDERLSWELKRTKAQAQKARASADACRARLNSVLAVLGVAGTQDPVMEINLLEEGTRKLEELEKAADIAERELRDWTDENQAMIEGSRCGAQAKGGHDAQERIELLREQRDAVIRERAQREEQRNSLLQSLEGYLAVRQEIELLSKRRQVATANLFTIQKTAEYLKIAREGLDGRYLGDLADRFDDYANAWLGDEQVEAVVTPDFGVGIYEGNSVHDVAGYSTGYQDLLDVCFRMALVDTVFQAELPFLIMDDPFSSLDEDKVNKAFQLLETLASKYQIIYFTCHPSRMEMSGERSHRVAFTLPEQRARRELPRARAKREAEERAKAQAELVASYAVVPVARGKAAIRPSDARHVVSNNLFSVEFVVDEQTGSADNSFEVHFIDGKGRVLCDRQTVQVIDGHVVPDRVRFCLSTREDSGEVYDLIIHEDGRDKAELAARIPYKANVSFTSMDFGF